MTRQNETGGGGLCACQCGCPDSLSFSQQSQDNRIGNSTGGLASKPGMGLSFLRGAIAKLEIVE